MTRKIIAALGLSICMAWSASGEGEEPNRLNEEVIATFLAEHLPEAIPLLAQAREIDPEAYENEMTRVSNRIREYRRMLKRSPEVAEALVRSYQIEFKLNYLSKDLANLPEGDEREERLAELRSLLEEIFDLRMKSPEMEIKAMEQRLTEIKDALERKRNAKDRIVSQRLKALAEGDPSALQGW